MLRAEVRRRGEDDVVDLGDRQQLLVGIEPGEAAVLRDLDAQLRELPVRAVQSVLEQVGEGDELDVRVLDAGPLGDVLGVVALRRIDDLGGGAERVEDRAGAAAAAADQADLDLRVLGRPPGRPSGPARPRPPPGPRRSA